MSLLQGGHLRLELLDQARLLLHLARLLLHLARLLLRGADELGVLELPVLSTHSVEEVGEVLAAQMAEQIGIEDQMFKLHFVDGEGDSVLVSTHTEIDDLLNCASITARLEPAVEQ